MEARFDVFLSYHWRDQQEAKELAKKLQSRNCAVFFDRWYLAPGKLWPQELERVLTSCCAVAVCIGPGGMGPWQQRETYFAIERQAKEPSFPVIPVLLPGAQPALGFLGQNTWVDLRDGIAQPFPLAILEKAIRGKPPGPEIKQRVNEILATISPYKGLAYFREEDAPLFFGRDAAIATLTDTICRRNFVALVGASGSGKSSVVRAGLVPRLRRENASPWEVVTTVPNDRPLYNLAAALAPLLEPDLGETDRLIEVRKLADALADRTLQVRDLVERILEKQSGTRRCLLIVDQWEELYTLTCSDKERRLFIDDLLEASAANALCVVSTLRGDFVGHALAYRPLSDRLQDAQVNLGPMRREELKLAIETPARKMGGSFEPGLVERILDDVADQPGNLPLLEFVLERLWDDGLQHGGAMRHAAYSGMGGVDGALAKTAEAVYDKLPVAERQLAQRLFMLLVRPGLHEDTRRRATYTELGESARELVKHLADARLLVTSFELGSQEETIEVAHEALIRHWSRLKDWLDSDREFLLWRERLRETRSEWVRTDRDSGALLHGALLTEAEHWLSQKSADLSAAEQDFIKSSLVKREYERVRHVRQRRFVIGGLAVGMAIAIVLATMFWRSQRIAKVQSTLALARQVLLQADLLKRENPGLLPQSILLDIESAKLASTFEAQQAISQSLTLIPRRASRNMARISHAAKVMAAAFYRDRGRYYLATATDDGTLQLWEVPSGAPVWKAPLNIHRSIQAIAVSPTDPILAVAVAGDVGLLPISGQIPPRVISLETTVNCLAFSPDGRLLAVSGSDGTIRIGSVRGPAWTSRPMKHGNRIGAMAFSMDGKYLATLGEMVADIKDGRNLSLSKPSQNPSTSTDRKSDQKLEITGISGTGEYGGDLQIWDVEASKRVRSSSTIGVVTAASFSSQGWLVRAINRESPKGKLLELREWSDDHKERAREKDIPYEGSIKTIALTQDGRYVVVAGQDSSVQLWDTYNRNKSSELPHAGSVTSVIVGPDDHYVATVGNDNTVSLWETGIGAEAAQIEVGHKTYAITFSPNGEFLAMASDDKYARIFEVATSRQVLALQDGESEVSYIVFSPDGQYLITGNNDNIVRVRSINRSHDGFQAGEVGQMKVPYLRGLALSRDGKYLAAFASEDNEVRIWEDWHTSHATLLASLRNLAKGFTAVLAFSPNGKDLALSSDFNPITGASGGLTVWRAWGSAQAKAVVLEKSGVKDIAFSSDSRYLIATGNNGKMLHTWDLAMPQPREGTRLIEGEDEISAMTLSEDELHLAAAIGGTVHIWRLPGWREVAQLKLGPVSGLAFDPTGRYLATASGSTAVRVRRWRQEDLIEDACSRLTLNLTDEEWRQYVGRTEQPICQNLSPP